MRVLYLVRHDEKAWKNGRKPNGVAGAQHDPPLLSLESSSSELTDTIERLREVQFDGFYVSPYLRTRQTASNISSALSLERPFEVASEIGEYLGNYKRGLPLLDAGTLEHYPNPVKRNLLMSETIRSLEARVKLFVANLPPAGNYLIVSHGLVLEKISGEKIKEAGLCIFTRE